MFCLWLVLPGNPAGLSHDAMRMVISHVDTVRYGIFIWDAGVRSHMDRFMQVAIDEAKKGRAEGGIPIGSVLVRGERIIGKGHNRRVQDDDPVLHAEIDCLRNAGRIGTYRNTVLYSSLMPCYLCSGAVVQFGIPKVIAGEAHTFPGARDFLVEHGVEVIDLNLTECIVMMQEFIVANPRLWNEDIGEL